MSSSYPKGFVSKITDIKEKKLKGLYEISSVAYEDHRGYMARYYDRDTFHKHGLDMNWLQESRSLTYKKHTVRGLHIHLPPYIEGKLIECIRGRMLWVNVDLRLSSPTFGQWETTELDGSKFHSLYISPGFANGCISLTDDADLMIKANQVFDTKHSAGIIWNDPDLAIDWQIGDAAPIISDAHKKYMSFAEFKQRYKGLPL